MGRHTPQMVFLKPDAAMDTYIIPAPQKQRHGDHHRFEASLVYTVSSKAVRATE